MGRLSLLDLPEPEAHYRVDLAPPCQRTGSKFETKNQACQEDLLRAALIGKACESAGLPFDRDHALELAERLSQCGKGTLEHDTLASKVSMGRNRIRVGGALWKFADENPDFRPFTLHPRGLKLSVEALLDLDPRGIIASFRSALNRSGADVSTGQLFAALHAEFDPSTELFDIHAHGAAGGSMIATVDRMRSVAKYRTGTTPGDRHPRIRIRRKPLVNVPYPLTYILQSSWPQRWRGQHGRSARRRIPEPFHTAMLLWFDKWSLTDVTLMMGLSVGREGLIKNNSNSYTNTESEQ